MDKVIFIVCDGLGDRPIAALDRKTPLEAAYTPNLDRLAQGGISGAMHTIGMGIKPGSDTAHLALFGYDPKTYYTGRGPFEVAGIGMNVKQGDICFRVNMGTVDNDLLIVDRRAGRIADSSEFARLFDNSRINGVKFFLKNSVSHRLGLIMRGEKLSANITDADPHKTGVKVLTIKPKDNTIAAKFTAQTLNKFLAKSYKKLKTLSLNKKRIKEGKLPANYLLVRGAGIYPEMPSLQEKYGLKAVCLAGAGLYKGVGRILGMETPHIKGATGKPDSNIAAKIIKVKQLYQQYDFFFVHFKGADTLGEDGDYMGKIKYIEKIDKAIKPLFQLKHCLIVLTADHSTPCALKSHSADDVPLTIYGENVRDDDVNRFNERDCAKGRLGHITGLNLMPIIIDLMGLAELFGA